MSSSDTNLLAIVLDCNPVWWGQLLSQNSEVSFTKCVDALIVFCNAHLMLDQANKLCLIIAHNKQNQYIYPKTKSEGEVDMLEDDNKPQSDGMYEPFADLTHVVKEQICDLVLNDNSTELNSDCMLTGAMSMALCYINRVTKEASPTETVSSRILVIKGSKDSSAQYMNFMSLMFTAQKMNVVLDACILDNDSNLLKQGCDILDGVYLKLPQLSGFMEYLLCLYLPSPSTRHQLTLPPRIPVGHKAACFCHRSLIDIGYICSVCLSIFCTYDSICPTCQSILKFQTPQRKKMKM
ncbi:hypothetical protein HELRODRAFT_185480 [Helobdella robusta]|uniref:General transcription factor IIH subunit 3 n=1 Tax=Helobdella robusta TaxID=6412 RepID=T1FMV6_HELRO|nr:hypothetical protein HELRODRAFT_185480 [Helobdella robusta]ESO06817.1 hypothetical protein HELRODRAFT_185480 [Helobdella robusta]